MFDFFSMNYDYEDRKVDNTEINSNTIVDTCRVSDGNKLYETGVQCPRYNNGSWVIVEAYDTKEEAQTGHNKWVEIMSAAKLPHKLIDCNNSCISNLLVDLFDDDCEYPAEF